MDLRTAWQRQQSALSRVPKIVEWKGQHCYYIVCNLEGSGNRMGLVRSCFSFQSLNVERKDKWQCFVLFYKMKN